MPLTTKDKGDEGEMFAMRHLESLGMKIVEMNYRFGRGEIDIIALEGETLVFCEVKSRKTEQFGDPLYAITPKKQQQIRRVARGYLFEHDIKEHLCRFDVVAIQFKQGKIDLNYVPNAF